MKGKVTMEEVHKIAWHYGYDALSRQCIDEMSELTVAINKYCRALEDCTKSINPQQLKKSLPIYEHLNVIEKIADVQVTLWMLGSVLNANADVVQIAEGKLIRHLERIERE